MLLLAVFLLLACCPKAKLDLQTAVFCGGGRMGYVQTREIPQNWGLQLWSTGRIELVRSLAILLLANSKEFITC
jgi:hypothetical protein